MSANFHPGVTNCGGTMASTGCGCPSTVAGEVDIDLMAGSEPMDTTPDYSASTPVEIDTELARLYTEHGTQMAKYSQSMGHVSDTVARHLGRGWNGKANRSEVETRVAEIREQEQAYAEARQKPDYVPGSGNPPHPNDTSMLRSYDTAQEHLEKAHDLEQQMEPLDEEFRARGGWTRAFLVTNQGGHVHSSMDCSTCFRTGWDQSGNWRDGTRYEWRTELSDATEDEVIEAAKDKACTVCYPNAPVETLNKPSTMFSPDDIEKAKARDERAAAKVARDAKKIANGLTTDGSEFEVAYPDTLYRFVPNPDDPTGGTKIRESYLGARKERFKTERAAVQWMVQYMSWGGQNQPDRTPAYDAIIEAVAAKHGKTVDEVRADIDSKVAAKRKRDGY